MTERAYELIDKIEVARRLGMWTATGEVSETAVDNALYNDPGFPKPRKLGRHNRWIAADIDDYIKRLPTHEEHRARKSAKQ